MNRYFVQTEVLLNQMFQVIFIFFAISFQRGVTSGAVVAQRLETWEVSAADVLSVQVPEHDPWPPNSSPECCNVAAPLRPDNRIGQCG